MKTLAKIALVVEIAALSAHSQAADDAPKKSGAPAHHATHAFLGVYVSSVHPALAANVRGHLSPEQGLIVEELAEDSPAAAAGIKVHDILATYDDQKLFSAEQLAKLVQSDKPGREVAVGFLHDGKLEKAQIKLGEAEMPNLRGWLPVAEGPPHRFGGPRRMMRRLHGEPAPGSEWENFDSLTLKKTGDDKFRVEVQYLDKEGKTRKHVFEGTREEIRKSILAEKDLQPAERMHLLHALGLPNIGDELPFPSFWFGPGPQVWFFDPTDREL
ncbi:MAG: PDZ domain-containing protein [Deltaproteobacteria bacterium]